MRRKDWQPNSLQNRKTKCNNFQPIQTFYTFSFLSMSDYANRSVSPCNWIAWNWAGVDSPIEPPTPPPGHHLPGETQTLEKHFILKSPNTDFCPRSVFLRLEASTPPPPKSNAAQGNFKIPSVKATLFAEFEELGNKPQLPTAACSNICFVMVSF